MAMASLASRIGTSNRVPCEYLRDGEWQDGFVIEDCGDGFFYVLPAYAVSAFHRTFRLGIHEIRAWQ